VLFGSFHDKVRLYSPAQKTVGRFTYTHDRGEHLYYNQPDWLPLHLMKKFYNRLATLFQEKLLMNFKSVV